MVIIPLKTPEIEIEIDDRDIGDLQALDFDLSIKVLVPVMNRGVLQSSPVQQMVTGNPNWWNLNSMRPPPPPLPPVPPHQQININPPFFPPNLGFFPYASQSWHTNELPTDHTWSQLLMGGLVGEEEIKGNHFQAKKLVNWEEDEEQVLHHQASSTSPLMVDVKQELNYLQYVHANNEDNHFHQTSKPTNWSASSPKSSSTSTVTCNNMLDFSSKISDNGKRPPPPDRSSSECNSPSTGVVNKKARVQSSPGQSSTLKVRKEKLGDRITALHQLVSPFGKTDTASVLLEAIGYIRFLQSQIEALSLPYLATNSSGSSSRQQQQHNAPGERNPLLHEDPIQEYSQEEPKKDLRSRGLCLVPVSCTLQVGSDNGADFWAPAIGGAFQ
ncbi:hypothetical protein ACFE04_017556 [Oxalis oulophora]